MAEIIPYNRIDRTEWSTLVRESATGTWFQSPEAYALFAALPELFEPFAIGIINENSKNIFSNQKSGDTACCWQQASSISTDSVPVSKLPLQNQPLSSDSVSGATESSPSEKDDLQSSRKTSKNAAEGTAYELRGVCVGYVTKEKNALRQWFTRRAIILGGPCLKDDAKVEEVRELGSERISELGN